MMGLALREPAKVAVLVQLFQRLQSRLLGYPTSVSANETEVAVNRQQPRVVAGTKVVPKVPSPTRHELGLRLNQKKLIRMAKQKWCIY